MKALNKYYLKITTLDPVHIGTGESFEPTSFVIDHGKLFEFDEVLFYKSLSELDKKDFMSRLDDWIRMIDFYKNHIQQAKDIYENSITVTKAVENKYKTVVNRDGTKNKNQFEIQKTLKNPNTHRSIIPGSSIKGMFDTVFGIYSTPEAASNEERQKLIVSDAMLLNGGNEIGFAYRKHKNPTKSAKSSIPQMVEIVKPNSTFIFSLSTEKSFEHIQKMMKQYHRARNNSKYQEDKKSFVARIGKFSGKEYMVYNGKNVKNSFGKPIATHTLYEKNDTPFGWIRIEKIDIEEYHKGLDEIVTIEKQYFEEKEKRQKELTDRIRKVQEEAQAKALQKQKEAQEAKRKSEEEEARRQAALASMSPLERRIEELKAENPNPNESIDILIFNALRAGKLDEFKCEALNLLKDEMQKLKKWVEKSKKPEKDKKYKRTLEVIKMLQECS